MNKLTHRCSASLIIGLSFAVASLSPLAVFAQKLAGRNQPGNVSKRSGEDPAILRWKILLSSLAQESRTVFPDDRRPYAIVEVADAYWEVDREASRQMYISALDAALSLTRQDKKYRRLINYVLSSATRRDANLAKELNKRLLDEDGDKDSVSIETALDMIDENPAAAAQLAEAFAPGGLADGTAAFLIFSLAKKDMALSDRVYGVYLSKVSSNESIGLEAVLALAGYAFGYSEYYTVDKTGSLSGMTYPPIPGLSSNRAFMTAFLNVAFRRLALTIDRRDRSVGADVERLNYLILFASEYLIPEIAKFSADTLPAWRQLQQRGIVGATAAQTQQIQNHILQIQQARLRVQKFSDGSQIPELEAETSLEQLEKLPGTCQRDVIRSKAALLFSSRKDFKKALEIAGKIEDLKQSESVNQAIAMTIVESAIENGELDEAEARVGKISSLEHRARLYIMLVESLGNRTDRQRTQETVNYALGLIEKLPDSGDRAAMLFGLSTILMKTDQLEAQSVLRNAVKNLNKKEPIDRPDFTIPIKVPLSCSGEEAIWYGGFETIPNSNVFEALRLFAKQNPDEATRSAEEIGDKITKLRALALITKIALDSLGDAKSRSKPTANDH